MRPAASARDGLLWVGGCLLLAGAAGIGRAAIPAEPVPSAQAGAWDAALRRARQVDVNRAGIAELMRLPGVGPALARRIVAGRAADGPFARPEDLARVPGVGPRRVAAWRAHVAVDAPVDSPAE